jgi:hypothetical protein
VPTDSERQTPRFAYLGLWAGLLGYVVLAAPGGSPEASAIDLELIKKIVSTPFDGTTNPIFVALFNSLGIIPAVLASLVLPGSKDQKVPALPFVILSFALGFFAAGPYLGLREINTDVTQADVANSKRGVFEGKLPAAGMLAFFGALIYYVITQGDFAQQCADFDTLFRNQQLVHVSTIDFTILSLAMWDPLSEDYKRRVGVEYEGESGLFPLLPKAWMYTVVPVLGPVLWVSRATICNIIHSQNHRPPL